MHSMHCSRYPACFRHRNLSVEISIVSRIIPYCLTYSTKHPLLFMSFSNHKVSLVIPFDGSNLFTTPSGELDKFTLKSDTILLTLLLPCPTLIYSVPSSIIESYSLAKPANYFTEYLRVNFHQFVLICFNCLVWFSKLKLTILNFVLIFWTMFLVDLSVFNIIYIFVDHTKMIIIFLYMC